MLSFLKTLFQSNKKTEILVQDPDYAALIERIRKAEESQKIEPGKKIHAFEYDLFEIRLDRDITNNYRITVFQGNERIYSFTVFITKSEIEKLNEAYKCIIFFLKGDQSISSLPNNDILKGFYFGNG
jgi:head-tail adaptor